MRSRRLTILVIAFLLSAAGVATAQDARPEVSGGYRYLHIGGSDGEDGTSAPRGWYVDVAYPITPMLSIVGDIGGHYKSESETFVEQGVTITGTAKASVHTFLFGVRLSRRDTPRVTPFGQVLFGAARAAASVETSADVGGVPFEFDFDESASEPALSIGGGVNVAAGSFVVRLQAEWLKILADDSGNAFRFGAGVVIPF
jgi:hypothetical protein